MKKKKKQNVIIDCDPGVDDAAAIALSLYDDVMDIKLITTVSGNLSVDKVTRNVCHILELFGREDIPVAKGSAKAMIRTSPDAHEIHQLTGLGNYVPPAQPKKQPIKKDAIEAMYEVINQYEDDISIIALGPHTNLGWLIKKHPDVIKKIKRIYAEGSSSFWLFFNKRWVQHKSFNASTDPEAVDIVLRSGIPITYIPSQMGREWANFTEEQVYELAKINDVGRFLCEMYSGYWERGYDDKRISTNDTCAVLAMRFPRLFRTRNVYFNINTTTNAGKTIIIPTIFGRVDFAFLVRRKKLHQFFFNAVKKLDFIKIYDKKNKQTMQNDKKAIVVIEGPSGVGKDTIMKALIGRYGCFKKAPSMTTREMRPDETQGNPYYFVTEDIFNKQLKNGEIFEYTTRHGTYRGMSKAMFNEIIDDGYIPLKDCDKSGFEALKKVYGDRVFGIFVTAPKNVIKDRLELRGDTDIDARLKDYDDHIKQKTYFDKVISNMDLDKAVEDCYKEIMNFYNNLNQTATKKTTSSKSSKKVAEKKTESHNKETKTSKTTTKAKK